MLPHWQARLFAVRFSSRLSFVPLSYNNHPVSQALRNIHVGPDPVDGHSFVGGRWGSVTSQGFDGFAAEWWSPNGKLAALHSFNAVRVPWISRSVATYQWAEPSNAESFEPLRGKSILDVGCGGGILSEPLCRLGAFVTGIDDSQPAVEMAQEHAAWSGLEINYRAVPLKTVVEEGHKFDAVVASEVIEHVGDQVAFVADLAALLKPSGDLFITTLNKTVLSKVLGVYVAENVGVLPRGIHDWDKFIPPDELKVMLRNCGLHTVSVSGLCYNPVFNEWAWSSMMPINYALHAVKLE